MMQQRRRRKPWGSIPTSKKTSQLGPSATPAERITEARRRELSPVVDEAVGKIPPQSATASSGEWIPPQDSKLTEDSPNETPRVVSPEEPSWEAGTPADPDNLPNSDLRMPAPEEVDEQRCIADKAPGSDSKVPDPPADPAFTPKARKRKKRPGPTSQRKIDANRENAKKSTGPRTEQGKRNSRRNRTNHGVLTSALLVKEGIAEEDGGLFLAMLNALLFEHSPSTQTEKMLLEMIAICFWTQRRIYKCHVGLVEEVLAERLRKAAAEGRAADFTELVRAAGPYEHLIVPVSPQLELLRRYHVTNVNQLFRLLTELKKQQDARRLELENADPRIRWAAFRRQQRLSGLEDPEKRLKQIRREICDEILAEHSTGSSGRKRTKDCAPKK